MLKEDVTHTLRLIVDGRHALHCLLEDIHFAAVIAAAGYAAVECADDGARLQNTNKYET